MPMIAMRNFTIRPEVQQWIAVGVPLAALAFSLLVVYPAYLRCSVLRTQVAAKRSQLQALQAAPIAPPGPVAPTAPDVPTEAPQFLSQMRVMAAESGCQIVGFDITPVAATSDAGAGGGAAAGGGAVRPVRSRIDLEAQYPQVRDFLARLTEAPRLFAVSDLTLTTAAGAAIQNSQPAAITPSNATVHASIEMERYVAPAGAESRT